MKTNLKNFKFKKNNQIPVDEFLDKALYKPEDGYYSSNIPFGSKGDLLQLLQFQIYFQIIGIWIISTWENWENQKI